MVQRSNQSSTAKLEPDLPTNSTDQIQNYRAQIELELSCTHRALVIMYSSNPTYLAQIEVDNG